MRTLWHPPGADCPVEVGDRDEVAALLGKPQSWAQTFAKYSRMGWPKTNPAPKAVAVDQKTRRDLYVLAECVAWEARRLGPGFRVP